MKRNRKSKTTKKTLIVNKWDTVLIKWLDACSYPGWQPEKTFSNTEYHVNTIGMFLGEDESHWSVCLNHGWSNGMISDVISIPKGMITYVEIIKRAL